MAWSSLILTSILGTSILGSTILLLFAPCYSVSDPIAMIRSCVILVCFLLLFCVVGDEMGLYFDFVAISSLGYRLRVWIREVVSRLFTPNVVGAGVKIEYDFPTGVGGAAGDDVVTGLVGGDPDRGGCNWGTVYARGEGVGEGDGPGSKRGLEGGGREAVGSTAFFG